MPKILMELLSNLCEREPLAPYTTFEIGGLARYFFTAHTAEEMVKAVRAAIECNVPYFILAGGSNVLVSDKGFDGLVILSAIKGVQDRMQNGRIIVTAGAGENWDDLVANCVEKDWAGLECLSGIPGTVGAAPVQNIGAYGQSAGDAIQSVEAVDSVSGALVIFSNAQCEFSYRVSIFKKARGRYSITRVTLSLAPHGAPTLAYEELRQYFNGKSPSLQEVRQAVIAIRAKKGYVIMPEYECYKTAGSFFMNPIITDEQFQKLLPLIQTCSEPWYWRGEDGTVKVSAACLLQSAGFSKGYRRGRVGISPKHALSIVNFADASAREILAFAHEIKTVVQERFNIKLEEEVQLVGF